MQLFLDIVAAWLTGGLVFAGLLYVFDPILSALRGLPETEDSEAKEPQHFKAMLLWMIAWPLLLIFFFVAVCKGMSFAEYVQHRALKNKAITQTREQVRQAKKQLTKGGLWYPGTTGQICLVHQGKDRIQISHAIEPIQHPTAKGFMALRISTALGQAAAWRSSSDLIALQQVCEQDCFWQALVQTATPKEQEEFLERDRLDEMNGQYDSLLKKLDGKPENDPKEEKPNED